MPLSSPPIQGQIATNTGQPDQTWAIWFNNVFSLLAGRAPFQLASYTVAGVPAASKNTACMVYISNESGGAVPAFSDGTNWRRVTDRAIIS